MVRFFSEQRTERRVGHVVRVSAFNNYAEKKRWVCRKSTLGHLGIMQSVQNCPLEAGGRWSKLS